MMEILCYGVPLLLWFLLAVYTILRVPDYGYSSYSSYISTIIRKTQDDTGYYIYCVNPVDISDGLIMVMTNKSDYEKVDAKSLCTLILIDGKWQMCGS